MKQKELICPTRIRRVPTGFSWIDQRLVREKYIQMLSRNAMSLYLFLVTVSDCDGLSYYADKTIGLYLNCDAESIVIFRKELIKADLLAYKAPLYQVLSLDFMEIQAEAKPANRSCECRTVADIIKEVWG